MPNKPTLREVDFVNEYLETKSGAKAADKAYNCKTIQSAGVYANKVLKRPHIQNMISAQAHVAIIDMDDMRKELQTSKTDYAVRYKINADFLDRAGFKPKDKVNLTQINVYTDEQQKRIAERILGGGNLRDRETTSQGQPD